MVYSSLGGSHGNLVNHGDGNIDGSLNFYPSGIFPSSSSNYESITCIPSILGPPRSSGVPLMSSLIQSPEILMVVTDGGRHDNADFGVNAKSNVIYLKMGI